MPERSETTRRGQVSEQRATTTSAATATTVTSTTTATEPNPVTTPPTTSTATAATKQFKNKLDMCNFDTQQPKIINYATKHKTSTTATTSTYAAAT